MRSMLSRIRRNHPTVVAYVALFFALGGAGAYADHLVVRSSDIVDNQVFSEDVRNDDLPNGGLGGADIAGLTHEDVANGSLFGADIADNSLSGDDIAEVSLGRVPQSVLGGFGRSKSVGGQCNPETQSFATCAFVTLNIPSPGTRVLMVGAVRGVDEPGADYGAGDCRVATSTNQFPSGTSRVYVDDASDQAPLTGITTPLGPGEVDFGVECNEVGGGIYYDDMTISAVAISPE
jgi:hypothetical protein